METNDDDSVSGYLRMVSLFLLPLVILIAHRAVILIRQLYIHPLSRFPGPLLAKISNLPYSKSYLRGRQPHDVLALHERYGSVVRVAPEELSFSSVQSWQDIYGARKSGQAFVKSTFYEGGVFAGEALSIVSERDPTKHHDMRKYLSTAFSERSLKEQEYLIARVIDQFIEKIGESRQDPIDLTTWFNLLTFDIIGELAFGESFGGLRSGTMHFWVTVVLSSLGQISWSDTLTRFPLLGKLFMLVNPGWLKQLLERARQHEAYAMKMVKKRIEQRTDRKDFMTSLLGNSVRAQYKISDVQLAAHASDFVIAGSETTATTLATITWYLSRNPEILSKVQGEVRDTFKSYGSMDAQSTSKLPYLHAVCLEALRVFPPLPLGLPRLVPEGGAVVDSHFVPGGTTVSTNPFAASMSSANFKNPWAFAPERWMVPHSKDLPDASQPFSVGPRACLGRTLAWMELHTILAKMHFMYDLELAAPGVDWQRDSEMHLLWKKPPLMTRVQRRHGVSMESCV